VYAPSEGDQTRLARTRSGGVLHAALGGPTIFLGRARGWPHPRARTLWGGSISAGPHALGGGPARSAGWSDNLRRPGPRVATPPCTHPLGRVDLAWPARARGGSCTQRWVVRPFFTAGPANGQLPLAACLVVLQVVLQIVFQSDCRTVPLPFSFWKPPGCRTHGVADGTHAAARAVVHPAARALVHPAARAVAHAAARFAARRIDGDAVGIHRGSATALGGDGRPRCYSPICLTLSVVLATPSVRGGAGLARAPRHPRPWPRRAPGLLPSGASFVGGWFPLRHRRLLLSSACCCSLRSAGNGCVVAACAVPV